MDETPEPSGSAPPPSSRRQLWRRRGRFVLLGLALLYPLYLGVANLFLGTAIGPWAVSLRPKRLTATWDRAWSLYPGDVSVRGLRLRGEASRARWRLDVDQGRGRIDLPGLLARRFRVVGFRGTGIVSVTERKPPPPPDPGRKRRRRGWRLGFENVHLRQVREVALDRLRLLGDSTVEGTFTSQVGAALRLERGKLASRGARLLSGDQTLARGLDLQAEAGLGPYAPSRHRGIEALGFLSGHLVARGETLGARASGPLSVDLRLEKGRLLPGTRLDWNLAVAGAPPPPAPPAPAAGDGLHLRVEPGAPGGDLQLEAQLAELRIGGGSGGRPPFFACRDLRVRSATPETRLSALLAEARQLRLGVAAGGAWSATAEAADLDLTSLGVRRSWGLHLDRASGSLSLASLTRREIAVTGLLGLGGSGWVKTADRPGPTLPTSAHPWAVRMAAARIEGLHDFAYNDLALQGEVSLRGGFSRDGDRVVRIAGAEAEIARGTFSQGGAALARDLDLRAALDLPRFVPGEQAASAFLEAATASLSGSGKALGLPRAGPARSAGRRAPGPEALNLDLRLERGTLAEGSQLALTLPRLPRFGTTDFVRIAQPLFVAGTVDGGRLNLSAEARGLTLGEQAGRLPLLRAQRATLSTSTPELHLAKLLPRRGGPPAAGGPGKKGPVLPAGLLGDLSADGLELNGLLQRGRWTARADRAGARIDLSALAGRRLALSQVTAIGIDVRLEPLPAGDAKPAAAAHPWTIAVQGARLTQIRALSLGPDRLLGPAEAGGDLHFDPAGRLALPNLAVALPAGRAETAGETVARDLSLKAEIRLAPASPETERGIAFLRRLSGGVRCKGKVMSLGFLHRYLRASWLEVRGQGEIDADLRLAEGRLLAGSRIALARGRLQADFLESRAEGSARLLATVEPLGGKPAARVKATFDQFTLAGGGAPESPYVRGQGLVFDLTSSDLDLATPVSDLRGTVDLKQGEVPDLRVYNAYLPEGAGASLEAGTGLLGLHFELDQAANAARGRVTLTSGDLLCRFQELEIGGRLRLDARLASRDLKGREFELDGTRLDLDQVAYAELGEDGEGARQRDEKGAPPPAWWAHLRLEDGTMTWRRPLVLHSRVRVEMKDSGLLLNLAAQRKSFLHWFENVLHVEKVVARGDLALAAGAIVIDPLYVQGGKLDLRSRFRFSRERKLGDLYVRWGKLATAVALRDGRRDWKILSPLAWFEKREGWGPR